MMTTVLPVLTRSRASWTTVVIELGKKDECGVRRTQLGVKASQNREKYKDNISSVPPLFRQGSHGYIHPPSPQPQALKRPILPLSEVTSSALLISE